MRPRDMPAVLLVKAVEESDPTHSLLPLADREQATRERELALRFGVMTVNEVRSEQGLPPVPWGDAPWLPDNWKQP